MLLSITASDVIGIPSTIFAVQSFLTMMYGLFFYDILALNFRIFAIENIFQFIVFDSGSMI